MNEEYVNSATARKALGICNKTLRNWAIKGKIDHILTEGGWRKYNINKYLKKSNQFKRKKYAMQEFLHMIEKKIYPDKLLI